MIFKEIKKKKVKTQNPKTRTTLPKIRKSLYNAPISGFIVYTWQKLWLIYLIINFIKQTTVSCLPNLKITYYAVTNIILDLLLYWKKTPEHIFGYCGKLTGFLWSTVKTESPSIVFQIDCSCHKSILICSEKHL